MTNQRPHLIEAAEAYRRGYSIGFHQGHKQGIAMERSRVRKVEWGKLAALIFVMTLAAILVAYYITNS